MTAGPLFDRIVWRDSVSGAPLDATIATRTPAGVPISGVLRIRGTDRGYPIVDSVARLTPELALLHVEWLTPHALRPPVADRFGVAPEDFDGKLVLDAGGRRRRSIAVHPAERRLRGLRRSLLGDRRRRLLELTRFGGDLLLRAEKRRSH